MRKSNQVTRLASAGVPKMPVIERAYDLADAAGFQTIGGLVTRLSQEGYENPSISLYGKSLHMDLLGRCRLASGHLPVRQAASRPRRQRLSQYGRPKLLD
jgi:hypothetical protein